MSPPRMAARAASTGRWLGPGGGAVSMSAPGPASCARPAPRVVNGTTPMSNVSSEMEESNKDVVPNLNDGVHCEPLPIEGALQAFALARVWIFTRPRDRRRASSERNGAPHVAL